LANLKRPRVEFQHGIVVPPRNGRARRVELAKQERCRIQLHCTVRWTDSDQLRPVGICGRTTSCRTRPLGHVNRVR
ncbi:hypothetical protein T12_14639, partial [Trichinella patagoniensis]